MLADFFVCFVMREKFQEVNHVECVWIFSLKASQDINKFGSIFGGFGHLSKVLDHDSDKELWHICILLFGFKNDFLFKNIISLFLGN